MCVCVCVCVCVYASICTLKNGKSSLTECILHMHKGVNQHEGMFMYSVSETDGKWNISHIA